MSSSWTRGGRRRVGTSLRQAWPLAGLLAGLLCPPGGLRAQRPAADTLEQHGDTLSEPRYHLPPITITAERTERQAPASTIALPSATIQQVLTTSNSAWDLLRQAGGFEVHQQGQGPGFASDASVRGFSSDHSTDIALWVDGVPINEPVNGHAEGYDDWSLLFPQAISDLEVIKGPSSPLFGNFAVSGVVNVHMLDRMHGTKAWLGLGSTGQYDGGVLTGFDHGTSGGVAGVRAIHDNGWRANSGWDLGQAYGRLVKNLSPSVSLDAGLDLYGSSWNSPGFLTESEFSQGLYDIVANPTDGGFKHRGQERVSLRVLSGPSLLWRTTAYATQGRWQLFLTTPEEGSPGEGTGSQTEEEDHRYGFGLTSALTWLLPRSEITIGTQNRFDHSDYQNWLTTNRSRDDERVGVSAQQVSGSLFIESQTNITRHVRLSLGGRYDVLQTHSAPQAATSSTGSQNLLSPKLGLLVHLPRLVSLYANVSRGFRMTDGVITDPALPLITVWSYESGVKLDARTVSATVSLFQMDVSNEQTFNPISLTSSSGGRSRRQGVEVEATVLPSPLLSITTDWTFNHARYLQYVSPDGDTLSGTPIFNTARYVGDVGVDITPPSGVRFRVGSNIEGPYTPFDEPGTLLPTYALFYISGSVRVGRAQLVAGVRNVADEAYAELRAGGEVSPGQPRSAYVTVNMLF
jgi:iron complex outermembrane recepter protein